MFNIYDSLVFEKKLISRQQFSHTHPNNCQTMKPSLPSEQAMSRQIASLEEKYLRYKNPKKPSQFFLIGVNRYELAQLTKNPSHYRQAINAFTSSIEGNPHPEQKYFCYRAKAYNGVGEYAKSVQDLKQAQLLPESGDVIKNAFMKNVMTELFKMQAIRQTIHKLKLNKELPESFLNAFEELTGTSERLVVKVGEHDEKIGEISDNMKFMANQIQWLTNQVATLKIAQTFHNEKSKKNQQNEQKISKLQQKVQQFFENFSKAQSESRQAQNKQAVLKMLAYTDGQVKKVKQYMKQVFQEGIQKVETRMDKIEVQHSLFVSRTEKEFAAIRKQLKNVQFSVECMEGKIVFIQAEVAENVKKIAFIEDTLKQSIYPRTQVKHQLQQWKQTEPDIYEYANRFYWMVNNYLLAYRMVSTGIIDGKEPQPSVFEKYFPRCLKAVSAVLSAVPGVSGLMDAIDGIVDLVSFLFDSYQEKKFQIKVKKINKFLMANDLQSISTQVGKAVIEMCKMPFKKNQIKSFKSKGHNKDQSLLSLAIDWFDQTIEDLVNDMEENKVFVKEHVLEKMVLRDVGLFFGLVTNDKKLMAMSLENAIIGVFDKEEKSAMCEFVMNVYQEQKKKNRQEADSSCLIY